jgi:hypothetical protein
MAVENTPLSATDHISAQLNSSNPPELSLGSESTDSNADDSADGDYEPDNEGLGVQEENDDEAEEDNKDSDEDVKSKAKANAKSRAHRSASKSEPISVAQSFADRVNAIGSGNGDLKAEFEEVQVRLQGFFLLSFLSCSHLLMSRIRNDWCLIF